MASREEMERLIGKTIADKSFRDQFLKDPKAIASSIGIELTPQQEETFKNREFSSMVKSIEKIASKSGFGMLC